MSVYQDIYWRELGDVRKRGDPLTLRRDVMASRYLLETYALKGVLAGHTGCVNSVLFSYDGGCIYTGSDDTNVNIYDTESLQKTDTVATVHTNNIFYARDMPGTDRNLLLTCAADGRVVLTNMATKGARRMHRHKGRAHRIALVPFENDQFYSCGEDGVCCLFDIRDSASRLFSSEAGMSALEENVFAPAMTTQFKNNRNRVSSIYTVGVNPLRSYQVALGGSSNHISLYDSRKFTEPVSYLCPESLASSTAHVTGLKYDHTGEMLIGSYNDDDVYSFQLAEHSITSRRAAPGAPGAARTRAESMESIDEDSTSGPDASSSPGYYRKYSGHRNNNTVKQVVFMGGRSDFVISGSDCGYIFIWDTHTAEVVQMLKADERGAINCLAPHPVLPMLATSGLENDAKVWYPTGEHKPISEGTEKKKLLTRIASRNAERNQRDTYSNSLMELIMNLMQYRSDAPLHESGDDSGEGEEPMESGSEDSGGDGSAGSEGSEESWDESWGDGEEGEGEGEGDDDEMDIDLDEEEEEGEGGEEINPAVATTTATGRDRWTRPAPRARAATETTAEAAMNTSEDVVEGEGEDSDGAEYGPQPAPAPEPTEAARRHRRHRHRRHHTRRRARDTPDPDPDTVTPPPEAEDTSEVESGSVSMQDIFEGRVGIVIDGVEVPWSQLARLMPAMLGRRRRTPSDTGDEERDGSGAEEEEGPPAQGGQGGGRGGERGGAGQEGGQRNEEAREEEDIGELVEVKVEVKEEGMEGSR